MEPRSLHRSGARARLPHQQSQDEPGGWPRGQHRGHGPDDARPPRHKRAEVYGWQLPRARRQAGARQGGGQERGGMIGKVATLLAGLLLVTSCGGEDREYRARPKTEKKLIILGLDGMDPVLLRKYMAEGR